MVWLSTSPIFTHRWVLDILAILFWPVLTLVILIALFHYWISCPRELHHLPKVSPYRTLWSYAIRESVDQRVHRLILPFARKGEPMVAVYMLGKWGIHLLDPALIHAVCLDGNRFPKKNYQEHLHFTFLSGPNVVFSNGEMWKRHSTSVKAAFDRQIPVHVFSETAVELYKRIGPGGVHCWSELVQRYTLDVVGKAALGHDFDAISPSLETRLSFVDHFNRVMSGIASPSRLMFPILDVLFPRRAVLEDLASLNARYDLLLQDKRSKPGRDILSYLLQDATLSHEELRSNLSILFSAGHDTTSGALSTAVYYLAVQPNLKTLVRREIFSVLGQRTEPTLEDLKNMTLLDAIIKESLRINSPISLLPARVCTTDAVLALPSGTTTYAIPAGVPIVPNVYAVHHNPVFYPDEAAFRPARFLASGAVPALMGGVPADAVQPGTFLPFGTGPRQCTARQFSLFEQRTLLAMLLVRYEWCLPMHSPHVQRLQNEFGAFGLSIPHDLDIQFVLRQTGEKEKVDGENWQEDAQV